ncbi:NlpC/P60 family protein [Georgenia satyanarayanai]|uniref:NlpC/P60 family protein n=1 Tax=Georgenia satyanarayanai TaxID=860221 RepID=UPI00204096AF|nr:C40 family peptidase [Georgenia satyanarayanai]MCM3660252.1 NlpC/P60 family protein [Georgenia satyanarayanai]
MGWLDRRRQAAVSVAVLALTSGMLVSSATAEPPSEEEIAAAREAEGRTASSVAELEVELASLATRLEDATVRAQQANEEYLGAQEALDEATARADEAREAAATAQAEVEEQRAEIGRIAMSAYRSGPGALGPIEPLLSADSFENAMQRATTTERMGTRADEALQRFQATELVAATFQRRADEAAVAQEDATTALAAAAEEARDAASGAETQLALSADRREGLIAQLAEQRGTTAELERERQDAQDQERRRREAEVARAAALEAAREQEAASRANDRPAAPAQPAPAPSRPDGEPSRPAPEPARPAPQPSRPEPTRPAPEPARPAPQPTAPAPQPQPKPEPAPQPPPSSSSGAKAALDWARTQLGKPYVWGAAGPNGYDCSGLTQTAFARAGISLPRTTKAQYAATTRVPVDQLQAGDLVFYSNNGTASGIYHVAIYAGDGMRLHAPSPGKTVELVPMYWPNVLPYGGRV